MSLAHEAMCDSPSPTLLLNSDMRMADTGPFSWEPVLAYDFPWIGGMSRHRQKRTDSAMIRRILNDATSEGWIPLRKVALMYFAIIVENLLDLGVDIEREGTDTGSALMAACQTGRLVSVRFLVRRGASITYMSESGPRSAVHVAGRNMKLHAWLLVKRFTNQGKLEDPVTLGECKSEIKCWSGTVKAGLVLCGGLARQQEESAQDYWQRLANICEGVRGKVIHPGQGRTRRPAQLDDRERVHVREDDPRIPNGDDGVEA